MDRKTFEKVELPSGLVIEAGDWLQEGAFSHDNRPKNARNVRRIGLLKMADIAELESFAGAVWKKEPPCRKKSKEVFTAQGGIANIH